MVLCDYCCRYIAGRECAASRRPDHASDESRQTSFLNSRAGRLSPDGARAPRPHGEVGAAVAAHELTLGPTLGPAAGAAPRGCERRGAEQTRTAAVFMKNLCNGPAEVSRNGGFYFGQTRDARSAPCAEVLCSIIFHEHFKVICSATDKRGPRRERTGGEGSSSGIACVQIVQVTHS